MNCLALILLLQFCDSLPGIVLLGAQRCGGWLACCDEAAQSLISWSFVREGCRMEERMLRAAFHWNAFLPGADANATQAPKFTNACLIFKREDAYSEDMDLAVVGDGHQGLRLGFVCQAESPVWKSFAAKAAAKLLAAVKQSNFVNSN